MKSLSLWQSSMSLFVVMMSLLSLPAEARDYFDLSRPGRLGRQVTVTCTTTAHRYQECWAGGEIRTVRLEQVLSGRCRYNQNWGYDGDIIWVSAGCSATFQVWLQGRPHPGRPDYPDYPNYPEDPGYEDPFDPGEREGNTFFSIQCQSVNHRYNECDAGVWVTSVRLVKNLSNVRCQKGVNFGATRNGVWVDDGCRGKFEVYGYR